MAKRSVDRAQRVNRRGAKSRRASSTDDSGVDGGRLAPTDARASATTSTPLLSLRQKLAAGLKSTGGRPALEGADRRQKIPMADADWVAVEQIARAFQAEGVHATPGQVAAQLLHDAVGRIVHGDTYRDDSARPPRVLPLAETVAARKRVEAAAAHAAPAAAAELAHADVELGTVRLGTPTTPTVVTLIDERGRKRAVVSIVIRATRSDEGGS
jgi:hypothetical protein